MWRLLLAQAVIAQAVVACGASPAPLSNREAKAVATSDGDDDGIAGDRDRCPAQQEDHDAFQDDDGCPDPDNDRDGVLDEADDCPYEAGPHTGCVVECRVFFRSNEDCMLTSTVFHDEHGVLQGDRITELVQLVHANPTIQALEVVGMRADLVAVPLRKQLPQIEIIESRRETGMLYGIFVTIAKQRFGEGRFRKMECTTFGAIYRPARPRNCAR